MVLGKINAWPKLWVQNTRDNLKQGGGSGSGSIIQRVPYRYGSGSFPKTEDNVTAGKLKEKI